MRRAETLAVVVFLSGLVAGACGPSPHATPDGAGTPDGGGAPDGAWSPDHDPDGDHDQDGISDADEGRATLVDTDADATPDYADTDSDGDGISDSIEAGDTDLATPPFDTDSDGVADFRDRDADGDAILDSHERTADPDVDGLPAFRDRDADGDCRSDTVEAGDGDLATPPVDTDSDGGGDFIDLDSDGDGLADRLEDLDCDGVVDPGESSATAIDSDGDGASDLVEVAAGTDPTNAASNPAAQGDFVFEVPYEKPPMPASDTLDFATDIRQADVFFVMDTTSSMDGEIASLKESLLEIIDALRSAIPSVAFGVGGYDDFPSGDYGSGDDQPFYLLHRSMTVHSDAGLTSLQAEVNALATHNGDDQPESGWEAMHQIATGLGVTVGGASVPPFDATTAHPTPAPPGEQTGAIGGVGFRSGSLPIVVWLTDARNHNSEPDPQFNYDFAGAAMRGSAVAELTAIGARVLAVLSRQTGYLAAREDATYAVATTGAVVGPEAWGAPGSGRPSGCEAWECCTLEEGAGEATSAGVCPLRFTIEPNGTGLGTSIVQAITVLTQNVMIDVGAVIADDPGDAIDAVTAFVERLEANPLAGPPCSSGLAAEDRDGDGVADTFVGVDPGTTVCFDVVPRMNTTVPATTEAQMFRATITVTGDGVTTLDTRDVYFLVPPEIPDPPVL